MQGPVTLVLPCSAADAKYADPYVYGVETTGAIAWTCTGCPSAIDDIVTFINALADDRCDFA